MWSWTAGGTRATSSSKVRSRSGGPWVRYRTQAAPSSWLIARENRAWGLGPGMAVNAWQHDDQNQNANHAPSNPAGCPQRTGSCMLHAFDDGAHPANSRRRRCRSARRPVNGPARSAARTHHESSHASTQPPARSSRNPPSLDICRSRSSSDAAGHEDFNRRDAQLCVGRTRHSRLIRPREPR